METCSRPLWGLVPRALGGDGFDLPSWTEALNHGTDPKHPEFWGIPSDFDQRFVEFASWGLALATMPALWRGLDDDARKRAAAYFDQINHGKICPNNWLFFRVLANMGLEAGGFGWDPAAEQALKSIDDLYVGDGWYEDGPDGWRDYYTPTGMHFYGLLYAYLRGDRDPERASRFRERAYTFAHDFLHWFDSAGHAIPFGRSLTYRFAQGAFWGALALDGGGPFSMGVLKGLCLRHLRAWLRLPIFDRTGILTVGYGYDQAEMAEAYNGPGSPAWAFKVFLPLALPEDHAFWTCAEEPMPPAPSQVFQSKPIFHIIATDSGRHKIALNGGQNGAFRPRHSAEKYFKFAYSTRFGFTVPVCRDGYNGQGPDNMLALSDDDVHFRVRSDSRILHSEADGMVCAWAPWPDVQIITALLPEGDGYGIAHRIGTARHLWAYAGGFSFPQQDAHTNVADGCASVSSPQGYSCIRSLEGYSDVGVEALQPRCDLRDPLTNLPYLKVRLAPGTHLLSACVQAGLSQPPLPPLNARLRDTLHALLMSACASDS